MIYPTVHNNGTSAQRLLDGYSRAFLAVREAIEKYEEIEFNARDYYPQGPHNWEAAIAEHYGRKHKLEDIASELEQIIILISEQS